MLTAKGNPSYSVDACATFVLQKREVPGTFESVCGRHHDPAADVKGDAVIFFDKNELGKTGLWWKVFRSQHKCAELISATWDKMVEKMKEPVVKMEPVPRGWTLGASDSAGVDAEDDCGPSSADLPEGVEPSSEPPFTPTGQRGEGQPSTKLRNHLRSTASQKGRELIRWYTKCTFLILLNKK